VVSTTGSLKKSEDMHYIILSLKHGTPVEPCFWRPDNAGYTTIPWAAGLYTEEEVDSDPGYYNNGYSTIAVPLTDKALTAIGFKCSYSQDALEELHRQSILSKKKNTAK
jgi:hypothetical protein